MRFKEVHLAFLSAVIGGIIGANAQGWVHAETSVPQPITYFKTVAAENFTLIDAKNNLRATLFVTPEGSAGLMIMRPDQTDKTLIDLSIDKSGSPGLTFKDRVGRTVWRVP